MNLFTPAAVHRHNSVVVLLSQAGVSDSISVSFAGCGQFLHSKAIHSFMHTLEKEKAYTGKGGRNISLKEGVICQNWHFTLIRQWKIMQPPESAAHLSPSSVFRLHLVKCRGFIPAGVCCLETRRYQTEQRKHRLQNEYWMLCGFCHGSLL